MSLETRQIYRILPQPKESMEEYAAQFKSQSTHIEKSKLVELVERIKMNMEQTGYDRGVNHACNLLLTELQKL